MKKYMLSYIPLKQDKKKDKPATSLRSLNITSGLTLCLILQGCIGSIAQDKVDRATHNALPPISQQWEFIAAKTGEVKNGWIETIGDPILTKLVREAQKNNPSLRVAAANIDAAYALTRQSRAALYPAIDAQASAQRSGQYEGPAPNISQYNIGFRAQWEIDLWSRIRSGAQTAVANAQAAEADYRFAQYSLASAVAGAYFTAQEAKLQIGVADRTVKALTEIHRIVSVRYQEGYASAQDEAIARTDLASARDRLTAARNGQRAAVRALEQLLGRYPANTIEIEGALPDTPALPPAGIPAQLLERRPDIIAMERRVAAAFSSLNQAKAAQFPVIALSADTGGASRELSSLLDGPNLIWSIVGNILQPIFDGGARGGRVDQARAEQRAAIAGYANAAIAAFTDAENNLDLGLVLVKRELELTRAAAAAVDAFRLAERQYIEGETDLIDVLNIQQRFFSAEQNLVLIRRTRLQQWVTLNLVLGGDWQSNLSDRQAENKDDDI